MTRTVADASRDYRNKQREKLKRYEAALREIAAINNDRNIGKCPAIARTALHIEV